jgi:hypothetical protein
VFEPSNAVAGNTLGKKQTPFRRSVFALACLVAVLAFGSSASNAQMDSSAVLNGPARTTNNAAVSTNTVATRTLTNTPTAAIKARTYYRLSQDFNITNYDAKLFDNVQKVKAAVGDKAIMIPVVDRIFLESDYQFGKLTDGSAPLHCVNLSVVYDGNMDRSNVLVASPMTRNTLSLDVARNLLGEADVVGILIEKAKAFSNGPAIIQIYSLDTIIALLNNYGTKEMAEDFINCGDADLKAAGESWALKNGYIVHSGQGSHRVTYPR